MPSHILIPGGVLMAYRIHYPPRMWHRLRRAAFGIALLEGVALGCVAAALLTGIIRTVSASPQPLFGREQAVIWVRNALLEAGYAP